MADAVVIPGRLFGPGTPLLMYSGDLVAARGARLHRHEWTEQPPDGLDDYEPWVRAQILPLPADETLLIGKSLGTNAAALAAERDLPAVWFTPLLTHQPVASALFRATAPFLLIGGTADPLWDGELGRSLTPHVFEVPGADHGMYVPGPVTASIAVLAQVIDAVTEFLDEIGWPRR